MKDYAKKEDKILDKIADTMVKLDTTLDSLDVDDNRVQHYYEQQKAIMEIRKITRLANRLTDVEMEDAALHDNVISSDRDSEAVLLSQIDNSFYRLDEDLGKLDESDSRVKSYIEQRKALHEVKRILYNAGKYDAYEAEEFDA
ncbi:MAG: hypothetical protein GXY32_07505 [Ruminococcaceae bacterium]|nr:hypothetical protein [Oscillospiraceae bacterium]